jgi:hypothetical protein
MATFDKNAQESDLPKISNPATRALTQAGYFKLEQFTEVTEADILKLHGVGPKGIRILNEALQARGLSFAQK